jgi:hypothetical protein
VDGRYFWGKKPTIHILSWPESYGHRLRAGLERCQIESIFEVEIAFGLQFEPEDGRWISRWQPDDLRRYILEHVLIHEIGHHVQYMQRAREGFTHRPSHRVSEQFAEDYALRYLRRQRAERDRRAAPGYRKSGASPLAPEQP